MEGEKNKSKVGKWDFFIFTLVLLGKALASGSPLYLRELIRLVTLISIFLPEKVNSNGLF